jgi:hypothetical protein
MADCPPQLTQTNSTTKCRYGSELPLLYGVLRGRCHGTRRVQLTHEGVREQSPTGLCENGTLFNDEGSGVHASCKSRTGTVTETLRWVVRLFVR